MFQLFKWIEKTYLQKYTHNNNYYEYDVLIFMGLKNKYSGGDDDAS